jgi:hypothetical protein
MSDVRVPDVGTTCPALINENYEYHLSGDCRSFCICSLNNQACKGRVVRDPDELTGRFFQRGRCMISQKGLESCPVYGASKEVFVQILKDKMQNELDLKIKNIQE